MGELRDSCREPTARFSSGRSRSLFMKGSEVSRGGGRGGCDARTSKKSIRILSEKGKFKTEKGCSTSQRTGENTGEARATRKGTGEGVVDS